MVKPIVGYFDIKGRAEPIRMLLKYAGVEFEDKRYPYTGPTGDKSAWLAEKFNLGLDFPNLPYYIEGSTKLTHTQAILHYLARKHGLNGKTEEARNRAEMLEQQIQDNGQVIYGTLFMRKDVTPEEKAAFPKTVDDQLAALSKFFGSGPFLNGAEPVWIDFSFYGYLTFINAQEAIKGCVDKYPNLVAFQKAVETIPKLEQYIKDVNAKGYMF